METAACTACRQIKPVTDFTPRKNRPIGRDTRCRSCTNEQARTDPARRAARLAWLAKRRSQLDALKLAAGCIDCGYAGHPAVLQWDHRDRSAKVANVGAMVGWAWAKVLAEMAKCDVRCANCHAIKTAGEGYGEGRPRIYPRSA